MSLLKLFMRAFKKFHLEYLGAVLYDYLILKGELSNKSIVKYSGYFDRKFYCSKYPDILQGSLDPLSHYLKYGVEERRSPSKKFDADFYYLANPEHVTTDKNPIVHYVTKGRDYGALTCGLVDELSIIEEQIQENNQYLKLLPRKTDASFNRKETNVPIVAFFTHNLNLEGATLVCQDLVMGVKSTGKMSPIVFSPLDGVLKDSYEKAGVKVVVYKGFNKQRINSLGAYQDFIDSVSTKIKELKVDYIHGNTILSFWVVHLANQLNLVSILHIHESEPISYHVFSEKFNFTPLIVQALELSYRVVFVSDNTREKYRAYEKNNNFTVIKNGVDSKIIKGDRSCSKRLRDKLGIEEHETVCLNVGTVTNRKGQIDIINMLQYLDKRNLELAHFVFVGDVGTRYSSYLHNKVNLLPRHISDKIHFINKASNVSKYYYIADIFLFTSRIESYPKVIQEAMLYGLPIISTAVDGIPEQIEQDVSALLYPAGDVKELAAVIDRIISDDELKSALGRNASMRLKSMNSSKKVTQELLQVFA